MTRPSLPLALLPVLMSVAGACGYSDPGEGTGSLEVIGRAVYREASEQTHVTVEVRDPNRVPIADAAVTVANGDTGETQLLTPATAGMYVGTLPHYPRRLSLAITTPRQDSLTAQLEGPGPHRILEPSPEAQPLPQDLPITWATDDGLRADYVVVEITPGGFTSVLTVDSGTYVVPRTFLRVGSGSLRLRRENALPLEGGLNASSLTVGYELEQPLALE